MSGRSLIYPGRVGLSAFRCKPGDCGASP
jgi:hypothetical protein